MQHQTMTRHKRLKMAHHNLFHVKMYSLGECFLQFLFLFLGCFLCVGFFFLSD